MAHAHTDPLAIRNQPALWEGRRRRWLVPAGVLCLVAVAMLAATLTMQIIIPWSGIVLTVGLYLTMVGCAIWVRDAHRRNLAFAWLMGAMAIVPALALVLITLGETQRY
ncbi:MAG: hypothetical protein J7484_15220 [Microbacterium sp.]|nr:hypothetical protein [Microbacterium sp.]